MSPHLRLVKPETRNDFEDGELTVTLVLPRACLGQRITVMVTQPEPEEIELDLDSPEIISIGRITGAPLPARLHAVALDQRDIPPVGNDEIIELDLDSPEIVAVYYDDEFAFADAPPARQAA